MYKPFRVQRRISFAAAAVLFAVIFPYACIGNMYVSVIHTAFCILLNLLSVALYGFMLYKALTRRFPVDDFSAYCWYMAVLAFCHLVFTGINWGGWLCIGLSAAIACVMLTVYMKTRRKEKAGEEKEDIL